VEVDENIVSVVDVIIIGVVVNLANYLALNNSK
jgi:hypothetical protein